MDYWMDFSRKVWWDAAMSKNMTSGGEVGMEALAEALSSVTRWKILRKLAEGGFYTPAELARAAGVKRSTASNHLMVLRRTGLVRYGKARLYELAPGALAEDGSRDVRLGLCTLHFGQRGEG